MQRAATDLFQPAGLHCSVPCLLPVKHASTPLRLPQTLQVTTQPVADPQTTTRQKAATRQQVAAQQKDGPLRAELREFDGSWVHVSHHMGELGKSAVVIQVQHDAGRSCARNAV